MITVKIKKNLFKYFIPLFHFRGLIIKRFNIPVLQDDFKIKFPKSMDVWKLGYAFRGDYEEDERKLVKRYLKDTDSVLELGACIGVVSLTINKILKDKTKQVSVEPNPQMLQYLIENKNNNNGLFSIETCIVSKLRKVGFFYDKDFLSSSVEKTNPNIIIPGKTLSEMIEQYFPFTVIVMDIEGGELEFFRSFDLKNSNIRLIIWETHTRPGMLTKDELEECYGILTEQGFNIIEKLGDVEAWNKI
jgi:FkbM family methyltransferase